MSPEKGHLTRSPTRFRRSEPKKAKIGTDRGLKAGSAPKSGKNGAEIRRSCGGVVEGGAEIVFSGYCTKNNFWPPAGKAGE